MIPKYNIIPIDKVERLNSGYGMHWFEASTKRFFRSRTALTAYDDNNYQYFVSSEQFDYKSPRLYSVRAQCKKCGTMVTVGKFQQYKTSAQAQRALKQAIEETPEEILHHNTYHEGE